MSIDYMFSSSTIQQPGSNDKKYIFQATTEEFKKYTTIQENRKIKPFFKNHPNHTDQSNLSKEKQSNRSNQDLRIADKHFPLRDLNPRLKTKKGSFNFLVNPSNATINNTIAIDDNSEDQIDTKGKVLNQKKFMPQNRSFSLKAYLDDKQQQKLLLPKLKNTQKMIEIVQNEFKQSKQRRKNPRKKNISHQITLQRQNQDQISQINRNQSSKSPSQRQVFKLVPSKQSLKPLLDLDYSPAYNKKRKIELMGMRLKPSERQDSKIGRSFENRTQRIGSINLLPSQLIYKNPKQSIQKSVYQQLIKRVFSTS